MRKAREDYIIKRELCERTVPGEVKVKKGFKKGPCTNAFIRLIEFCQEAKVR